MNPMEMGRGAVTFKGRKIKFLNNKKKFSLLFGQRVAVISKILNLLLLWMLKLLLEQVCLERNT